KTSTSAAAAAAAATPTPTPVPVRQAAAGRKYTIQVWHPWGGTTVTKVFHIADEFEKTHPDIGVKMVYSANNLSTSQKFFAAVAGGVPPEVIYVDGPEVAGWAYHGVLRKLDPYYATSKLGVNNFWTPVWNEIHYNGNIWAMAWSADPNFGFFWNKDVFKEVGLDPEKPPTTMQELDDYNAKITKITNGKVERIGIIPWGVYGNANSMVTWGWVYGGHFYDDQKKQFIANNEQNIAALDWMVSYAKKFNITNISGFSSGFGQLGLDGGFIQGKVAMQPFGPWELPNFKKYGKGFNYGVTYIPAGPSPAKPHQSWVGGWCMGLPTGSKDPDQGWEWLSWIGADPTGTEVAMSAVNDFSGSKTTPYLKKQAANPELAPFVKILEATLHQRPVTPVTDYFMGSLDRHVGAALYGKATASEALAAVDKESTAQLQQALSGK
ncbi:MAG: ABC transporter substrate-binding protein, partial [Chloroflexi bacterium]|nr:ABC transporter substrate-binding protein [Chloroflexota bacterium]